jgi:hypothetical protein
VGLPTQSLIGTFNPGRSRRGVALPSAMFALVAASILVAGVFAIADLSAKATLNQERATRAMQVAEAGMAHTLSLLRGPLRGITYTRLLKGNSTATTTDDSLLIGTTAPYSLAANDQIPLAGKAFAGGTYFVSVRDDSADTDGDPSADMNGRIRVRCRAVMADGSAAEINAIVGAVPMFGIVMGGNTEISSSATVSGACGSIHVNGNLTGGGSPTVTAGASATGTVGPGSLAPQLEGQAAQIIPNLIPAEHCPPTGIPVVNALWLPAATDLVNGNTYCVTGNVQLSNDFATMANKRTVSIIASGSIKISAKPMMKAAHPDGFVLLAGGDLDLQGDFGLEGVIYGGGQCYVSSAPVINGQFICRDNPTPPGTNWVSANLISGSAQITFDCSTNSFNKRRALFWYPRIGA